MISYKVSLFNSIILSLLFFISSSYLLAKDKDSVKSIDISIKNIQGEKEKCVLKIESLFKIIKNLVDNNMFLRASEKIKQLKKEIKKLYPSDDYSIYWHRFKEVKKGLYDKWANILASKAKSNISRKKWVLADRLIKDSINVINKNPDKNVRVNFIKSAKADEQIVNRYLEQEKYKKDVSDIAIKHLDIKDKLKKLLTKALSYEREKDYRKAIDSYKEILAIDPYNSTAVFKLKKLYKILKGKGEKREYLQMKERMAQIDWGYVLPIRRRIKVEKEIDQTKDVEKDELYRMREKVESIKFPVINFKEASFGSIIDFIRRNAKNYDTKDHKGVNIDLRLGEQRQKILNTPITMHLTNISLIGLVKYLCMYVNLDYQLDPYGIIIGIPSKINKMVVRYIPIKSGLINSIAKVNKLKIKDNVDIKNKDATKVSNEKVSIKAITLSDAEIKNYFAKRGVPFPSGSSITWDMNSDTLIVKNTLKNIKILKELLHEIDFSLPLVQIEAKFIEINQSKYEGLGFDWKVNLEKIISPNKKWSINDFIDMNNESSTEQKGNDSLVRTGNMASILYGSPFSWGSVSGNFQFWIYALSQKGIAETLSAPRIVTKSGSPALIEVVEKNWYATSWDVSDPEIVSDTVSITAPKPNVEETKLGIVMKVTPTVNPDMKTISMDLNPIVRKFVGWDLGTDNEGKNTYVYRVIDLSKATVSSTGQISNVTYESNLPMPIIADRNLHTKLIVKDGETVALGGMLYNKTVKVDDKYPILGDIPLIGRLFRSKDETVQKYNLLIFVTVKLIYPDGRLVNPPKPRGIFVDNRYK